MLAGVHDPFMGYETVVGYVLLTGGGLQLRWSADLVVGALATLEPAKPAPLGLGEKLGPSAGGARCAGERPGRLGLPACFGEGVLHCFCVV